LFCATIPRDYAELIFLPEKEMPPDVQQEKMQIRVC
jgi:hypothetical protein